MGLLRERVRYYEQEDLLVLVHRAIERIPPAELPVWIQGIVPRHSLQPGLFMDAESVFDRTYRDGEQIGAAIRAQRFPPAACDWLGDWQAVARRALDRLETDGDDDEAGAALDFLCQAAHDMMVQSEPGGPPDSGFARIDLMPRVPRWFRRVTTRYARGSAGFRAGTRELLSPLEAEALAERALREKLAFVRRAQGPR